MAASGRSASPAEPADLPRKRRLRERRRDDRARRSGGMRDRTGEFLEASRILDGETLETPSVAEAPLVADGSAADDDRDSDDLDVVSDAAGLSADAYLRAVRKVDAMLLELSGNVESLKRLNQNSLVAVTEADVARSESALQALIEETDSLSDRIGRRLKALELPRPMAGMATLNQRNKQLHHARLARHFLDLLTRYRNLEGSSRNAYVKRLTRQYRVVKPDATKGEIDRAIEMKSTPVFAAAMVAGARSAQASSALAEVEERHREILNIDSSLQRLSDLFQQMRTVVSRDEEKLQTIAAYVEASGMEIEEAEKKVSTATRTARSIRKQKWVILITLLIVVCVTGLVLGLVIPRATTTQSAQASAAPYGHPVPSNATAPAAAR